MQEKKKEEIDQEQSSSQDSCPLQRANNLVAATPKETRTASFTYEPFEKMFPITATDAMGHVTQLIYDRDMGVPVYIEDPNGVVTKRLIDGFGRVAGEGTSGGVVTTVARRSGFDGNGRGSSLVVETETSTGATSEIAVDRPRKGANDLVASCEKRRTFLYRTSLTRIGQRRDSTQLP